MQLVMGARRQSKRSAALLVSLGMSSKPLAHYPDSGGFQELSLSEVGPFLFWVVWGSFECNTQPSVRYHQRGAISGLPGLAQQLPKVQACSQAMVIYRCTL